MKMYFRSASRRADLSAPIMVAAILMAAGLSKLGHGWWAITVMAALCGLVVAAEQLGWSTRKFVICECCDCAQAKAGVDQPSAQAPDWNRLTSAEGPPAQWVSGR